MCAAFSARKCAVVAPETTTGIFLGVVELCWFPRIRVMALATWLGRREVRWPLTTRRCTVMAGFADSQHLCVINSRIRYYPIAVRCVAGTAHVRRKYVTAALTTPVFAAIVAIETDLPANLQCGVRES